MPWMEVTMPKRENEIKEGLVKRLNQEFIDATGFEEEILYIRISEFERTDAGAAGQLAGVAGVAHVVLYCPRMRFDVKRMVVSGITNAFAGTDAKPLIHILEFPYENIGVEGKLLTDTDEELASRPFYYVVPR
ncbi:hypothetical protein L0222_02535 [bacterium]|nr:hypothetical protein [bacterium]MCI0602539.1 hypothetical protein [bacterium]